MKSKIIQENLVRDDVGEHWVFGDGNIRCVGDNSPDGGYRCISFMHGIKELIDTGYIKDENILREWHDVGTYINERWSYGMKLGPYVENITAVVKRLSSGKWGWHVNPDIGIDSGTEPSCDEAKKAAQEAMKKTR